MSVKKTMFALLAICFLLSGSVWAQPQQQGGPIVLMGIDAEDGGPGEHGPISVYGDVVQFILNRADSLGNTGSGILVIGGGKSGNDDVTQFWNAVGGLVGETIQYVNGAANITAQSFSGFRMIAVVSDAINTANGGLTEDENNALATRSADIANFVNDDNGGLLGFSSSGQGNNLLSQPYGYLPSSFGQFEFNLGLNYNDITPTVQGDSVGITNALDVCCWHDEYVRFPTFLDTLAFSVPGATQPPASGFPAAIGGNRIIIPELQVELSPDDTTNFVGEQHTVTATVTRGGQAVEGADVTFSVTGDNPQPNSTIATGVNGMAVYTYTGQTAGRDTISATTPDPQTGTIAMAQPAFKTWIAGIELDLTQEDSVNVVGETHTVTATVTRNGQAVEGADVTFSVAGVNPQPETTIATDANGMAMFMYSGTSTGIDTISATADDPETVGTTEAVTTNPLFKQWEPGIELDLTQEDSVNVVGETHTVTATVTRNGQAVEGADVTFSVAGVNPQPETTIATDANGMAMFMYIGMNTGVDTISATADDPETVGTTEAVTTDPLFKQWEPGIELDLTQEDSVNVVGETHTVTATVTRNGQAVEGADVTFSVAGVNPQPETTIATDANGMAMFMYSGTSTGIDTISATADDPETVGTTEAVTTDPLFKQWEPGIELDLTQEDSVNVVGETHTVTATVTRNGQAVEGADVTFSVAGVNPQPETTIATDANGMAMFMYSGTSTGIDTISATADDPETVGTTEAVTTDPLFKQWEPGIELDLTQEDSVNVVGETHTVTATVTRNGQAVEGADVTFSVAGVNPQPETTIATDANGMAMFMYSGTSTGIDTISATADDPETVGTTEAVTTDPLFKQWEPGIELDLTQEDSVNVVGETHTVTATVTRNGQAVEGADVTFSVAGVNPQPETTIATDANGMAMFMYSGTSTGIDTISATADDPETVGTTEAVTTDPLFKQWEPGIELDLTQEDSVNVVGETHTVTATVTRNGQAVEGADVTFSVAGVNPQPETTIATDANGMAMFMYSGTSTGIDTISATADDPETVGTTEAVTTDPINKRWLPGIKIDLTQEKDTNIVGEKHTVTATVSRTDSAMTPVEGADVTFTVSGVNPQPNTVIATDSTGMAMFMYIGMNTGVDTISATADDPNTEEIEAVTTDPLRKTWTADSMACELTITTPEKGEAVCDSADLQIIAKVDLQGPPIVTEDCKVILNDDSANPIPATFDESDSTITATIPAAMLEQLLGFLKIEVHCTFFGPNPEEDVAVCNDAVVVNVIDCLDCENNEPPFCPFPSVMFDNGTQYLQGTITDDKGIATIEIDSSLLVNALITIDSTFTNGDTETTYRVDLSDPSAGMFMFNLIVTDICSLQIECDPAFVVMSTDRTEQRFEFAFQHIDRYMHVTNDGLSEININLNDQAFTLVTDASRAQQEGNTFLMPTSGELVIDMLAYLVTGANDIVITYTGEEGAGGSLLLIDTADEVDIVLGSATSVEIPEPLPTEFSLQQNYPNPFNPTTNIVFAVPSNLTQGVDVKLTIYNLLGEEVRILVDSHRMPGRHTITWDGRNQTGQQVTTGIYLYRVVAGEFRQTRRMILMK